MKTAKITTLIASIIFLLAAIGNFMQMSQFRAILAANNSGGNSVLVPPIVEVIFAVGSFLYWLYIVKQEKKGIMTAHARLIGITLVVLSFALSWALAIWFVMLPIYNLSSAV